MARKAFSGVRRPYRLLYHAQVVSICLLYGSFSSCFSSSVDCLESLLSVAEVVDCLQLHGVTPGAKSSLVWLVSLLDPCCSLIFLAGIHMGLEKFSGNIQAYPLPKVNNGSGPFHKPDSGSFHLTAVLED